MSFASSYLKGRLLFPELIKEAPEKDTGLIIVVPSCNEPGITSMLDSLALCNEPACKTEVIIIINEASDSNSSYRTSNLETIRNVYKWKERNANSFFRVYVIDTDTYGIKDWGVGLARKTGMDEAVRRFDFIDKPDGIILSLDADCKVETNYLESVFNSLSDSKERTACSIYFEHPVAGNEFNETVYNAITLYELHLRYYFQGLLFSGFPYAHHTIGSAFAVKALSYVKAGGMNRRMAGEDFYFIQKLISAGGYFDLNTTTVYPSPRPSARVPFGTGATIFRMTETMENEFLTYNIKAFHELKKLFSITDLLFSSDIKSLNNIYSNLPEGFKLFIGKEEWITKIDEIKRNTASLKSFRKRFYDWFNLFRIVKYLNMVSSAIFEKKHVTESAFELLKIEGHKINSADPLELLFYYRHLEKRN